MICIRALVLHNLDTFIGVIAHPQWEPESDSVSRREFMR